MNIDIDIFPAWLPSLWSPLSTSINE